MTWYLSLTKCSKTFLVERKLSQSGIISMFCFQKTFSFMITHYPPHLDFLINILLEISFKIQWCPNSKLHLSSLTWDIDNLTLIGAPAISTFLKPFLNWKKLKPRKKLSSLLVYFRALVFGVSHVFLCLCLYFSVFCACVLSSCEYYLLFWFSCLSRVFHLLVLLEFLRLCVLVS